MATRTHQYMYAKLDEAADSTRLLHLLPCLEDSKDQSLRCELQPVSLASAPPYTAVSYTWGAATFPRRLILDDAAIPITENLYQALIHFRRQDESLVLWVDAICIDQSSDAEKAVQIPLMDSIYRAAKEVYVWLGQGTDESLRAMVFLQRIGSKFLERGTEIGEPRDDTEQSSKHLWDDVMSDPSLAQGNLIWDLPWFTRRWVIQELAFAKLATVHLGHFSMLWEELFTASEVLMRLGGDGSILSRRLTDHSGKVHSSSSSRWNITVLNEIRQTMTKALESEAAVDITRCVANAWSFECKEDKDKVFALLGILNHGRTQRFDADYRLPPAEIFKQFSRFCLEQGDPKDCLDLLSYAGLSRHEEIDSSFQLPSWAPDWRLKLDGPACTLNDFRAAHLLGADIAFLSDPNELMIRGLILDRVAHVHSPVDRFNHAPSGRWDIFKPNHEAKWLEDLERIFSYVFGPYGSSTPYVTGGTAWEALMRSLILDRDNRVFNAETDLAGSSAHPSNYLSQNSDLHEEYAGFRAKLLTCLEDQQSTPAGVSVAEENSLTILSYELIEYHTRVYLACKDRAFYITERGLIGLGPKKLQPGDVVALPAGASVPYVLRPTNDGLPMMWDEGAHVLVAREGLFLMPDGSTTRLILRADRPRYQLVGECYTHGLMYGKAWQMSGFPFEEFILV